MSSLFDSDPLPQLHLLSEGHDLSVLKKYISEHGYTQSHDEMGWTPIGRAVWRNRLENVAYLCGLDATNLNERFMKAQQTILHIAARSGNLEMCQLLLKFGVEKTILNYVSYLKEVMRQVNST